MTIIIAKVLLVFVAWLIACLSTVIFNGSDGSRPNKPIGNIVSVFAILLGLLAAFL